MFDIHKHTIAPAYPQTVTHKHAPTIESVRLLKEMEEAAEQRVIERGELSNNILHARWTVMMHPYGDLQELHCRYQLNGKDHSFELKLCPHAIRSRESFKKLVVDKILERVTEHLAIDLLEGHLKTLIQHP